MSTTTRIFTLSAEDRAKVEALGGLDKLMELLKQRLAEQKGRHAGCSKWIGTGGTSPFGAYGYNPEGIRVGQESGGSRSAVKVWDERSFRNLDGGGSMDPHVRVCEELFSAAKSEFRHLEYFYFHNCIYDFIWRDNSRRSFERLPTQDILHKYGPDWKLIVVGDAAMSPYELTQAGGSVEYSNSEPGITWLRRLFTHFRRVAWWNPEPQRAWEYTRSTQIVLDALGPRMFPLTLSGVANGIDALRH